VAAQPLAQDAAPTHCFTAAWASHTNMIPDDNGVS